MKVYMDNAATTPMETDVVNTMKDVMESVHGNPSSIHNAGRKARIVIEDARKRVAQNLKASVGEIFFTSSATESNNTVLFCAIRDLGVKRIISSPTEHPCILNSLKSVQRVFDVDIQFLPVDDKGNIDPDTLDHMLSQSDVLTLVSLMHGNNEIGTMLDLETISKVCQSKRALFHTDAVQTVGKYHIDLSNTPVSFLSASGHKIYGPKGCGIIYINNDNMIGPYINGGGQERTLRSGTENIYGISGFATALDWLCTNRKMHYQHTLSIRKSFIENLQHSGIDYRLNGNQDEKTLSHILSLNVPKTDKTELIMFNLDIHGICASAGSACSSGVESQSHVLDAINMPYDRKTIRFSFSHHNTKEEVAYVVRKLQEIL